MAAPTARSSPGNVAPRRRWVRMLVDRHSRNPQFPLRPGSNADKADEWQSLRRNYKRPRELALASASYLAFPKAQERLAILFGQRRGIAKEQKIFIVQAVRRMGPIVRTGENNLAVDDGKLLVHQAGVFFCCFCLATGEPAQWNLLSLEKLAF